MNATTFKPSIEALEARELPAVNILDNLAWLNSWSGTLYINGTAGNDTVVISETSSNSVHVSMRNSTGSGEKDFARVKSVNIRGYKGNDVIDLRAVGTIHGVLDGGDGNDRIYGGGGNDRIWGECDSDVIYGGKGNDTISGDGGNDAIFGGEGADLINGGESNDILHGDSGNDILFGNNGNDRLFGIDGDDLLSGDSGNDQLFGGNHSDTLNGGIGNDLLRGGSENDRLNGGDGNDVLFGDAGNDKLFGSANIDTLFGGADDDWLEAGAKEEFADGGAGTDWNAHKWAIKGTKPSDIHQQEASTCVLLATLAAATRNGRDLSNRIRYEGDYKYRVFFYDKIDGKVDSGTVIYFDGRLLSNSEGKQVDPKPREEGEFWVVLMQRAYLQKFHGIDQFDADRVSAFPGEYGLKAMTAILGPVGAQYYYARHSSADWLKQQLADGRTIIASLTGKGQNDNHAYAVMNVVTAGNTTWVRL